METPRSAVSGRSLPVPCPRCGAALNRHAEKLVSRGTEPDVESAFGLGGALEEFHTCPNCRFVLERRSS